MNSNNSVDEIKLKFPFLSSLKMEMLKRFMETIKIKKFPIGTMILEEGAACTNMVFVLSGIIRVYKLSPEGKEITLYRLGKGETCVLSVSCIMGNAHYPAIAQVEEEAILGIIPAGFYKELFLSEAGCQQFIFNTISTRLQEVMLLIDEVVFKNMDTRLAAFIIQKLDKSNIEEKLDMTHEKIAIELGTAREVVSRLLKDFEKKNIVSLSRGRIIVKNKELLKKIAGV
ncbi:MAG TPA: Crp/Fnr family transcriptional regulator [Clostridiaceae bacterium]